MVEFALGVVVFVFLLMAIFVFLFVATTKGTLYYGSTLGMKRAELLGRELSLDGRPCGTFGGDPGCDATEQSDNQAELDIAVQSVVDNATRFPLATFFSDTGTGGIAEIASTEVNLPGRPENPVAGCEVVPPSRNGYRSMFVSCPIEVTIRGTVNLLPGVFPQFDISGTTIGYAEVLLAGNAPLSPSTTTSTTSSSTTSTTSSTSSTSSSSTSSSTTSSTSSSTTSSSTTSSSTTSSTSSSTTSSSTTSTTSTSSSSTSTTSSSSTSSTSSSTTSVSTTSSSSTSSSTTSTTSSSTTSTTSSTSTSTTSTSSTSTTICPSLPCGSICNPASDDYNPGSPIFPCCCGVPGYQYPADDGSCVCQGQAQ